MWWTLLLQVLEWLLQWFMNHKKHTSTDRERRLANAILLKMQGVREAAYGAGFDPTGGDCQLGYDPSDDIRQSSFPGESNMDPVTQYLCDEICAEHAKQHKTAQAVGGPFLDGLRKIIQWLKDNGVSAGNILKYGIQALTMLLSGKSVAEVVAWLISQLFPSGAPSVAFVP